MITITDEHKWEIGYNGTYSALWNLTGFTDHWARVLHDRRKDFGPEDIERWQAMIIPELERLTKFLNDEFTRLANPPTGPLDKQP